MQAVSTSQEHRDVTDPISDFVPILIQEIELSQPLSPLSAYDKQKGQTYQRTRCLVRLHTQPLGPVDFAFTSNELYPDEYAPRIWELLGEQINAHLREDSLPEVTRLDAAGLSSMHTPRCIEERENFLQTAPFVSVILATRDRPDRLARCLPSLLSLRYPDYEVIVVDNAPSTSATADFIQQRYADEPGIRYVREDRPGLSLARNRGIQEARGEIIAFTDDDVVVDTYWLAGLVRGFGTLENVACVAGLILPLELETPAQFLFEAQGGLSHGFSRRIFDLREHHQKNPSYPYIAGACSAGAGASMAFTASFLRSEGGFDPALGAGSPTCGGEDVVAFLHVILHGYRLVYDPASLIYHQHRRDYTALQKQLYGYGIAYTAYLTRILIDHPLLILDCLSRFVRSLFVLWRHRAGTPMSAEKATPIPQELKLLRRKGQLRGPLTYIRSRWSSGWRRKKLASSQAGIDAIR